ncbi:Ger(x)C family spore germination protein [Brevibacillus brevis]|uniref:Ger(x)C family spore germination protein n=1 Tax=Brevibacillus brevis TaxID=1393 RepID=UPI000D110436|nr:Ger(x)C family spore germination protein [Brevibacillus brevis]PSJ67147.1 Ger(x)C family spore germination protein [Brevibacillus brevis]RED25716.1 Ger(x)C family germination protein [Brevibacillus brevis]GEC90148.1 germination protein [Brevibacillus brevis]VEF87183.1 Spore germination protein B3 precursor [Brevibacillus brevis]
MKRFIRIILSFVLIVMLTGCYDRLNLEDATLSLMIGIDLNEKNELLIYMTSPVFSREAKEKTEEFGLRASSMREARMGFDEIVTALTVSGKIQLIVLGKRLLQHPDWFRLLDVVFRDAKFTVNARMVMLDGPLNELFEYKPKDKPRLALHMTKLIDTANQRNLTVKTRAQEFHRQMFEKGMTPHISELKKTKHAVRVMGTALLTKKGAYAGLIEPRDTILLQMLLHGKQGEISVTLPVKVPSDQNPIVKERVSFFVKGVNKKVKTTYRDGTFHFDIQLKLRVSISERLFPFNMEKEYKKLEQMIAEELHKNYAQLIKKCQEAKTDPFGFGLYARAYEYEEWKKVKDDWPTAFSKATVQLKPEVTIKGNGVIK